MKNIGLCALLTILLLASGCSCKCNSIDTTIKSGYQITNSTITVFADGCASSSGVVSSSGIPQQICDGDSGQPYLNRGRWVKEPNISAVVGEQLYITTQGLIYFCTTGYDNQNPSPTFSVYPGRTYTTNFSDNSQMSVQGGDIIVVEAANGSSSGVAIGSNTTNITASCSSYSSLIGGTCRGKNGFGLSIYVGEKAIVTLDNQNSSNNSSYKAAQLRSAYLFNYIQQNDLTNFFTDTYSAYKVDLTNYGTGQFSFMVPAGTKGLLGFSIAQGSGSAGTGSYSLTVRSTPSPCLVMDANSSSNIGNRGALQMLISSTNPNDIDDVISNFNALDSGNEIAEYYPQLNKFIANTQGVTISSNATALSSLVTPSTPNITPTAIITGPNYNILYATSAGNIWYKVLDDYYSDNVGEYTVTTESVVKVAGVASQFLTDITNPIITALASATAVVYQNFQYAHFLNIIRLTLLLYMIVFGIEFMLGLVEISSHDLIARIFKIAVVIELFDPGSWEFFNSYFFKLFLDDKESLISAITGDYSTNKSGVFGFVDNVFTLFFAPATWLKIVALFPYGVGFLFLGIIAYVIILYVFILAKVIVAYLLTVVGISLLISLAPIFLTLILFQSTRKYFDNWIKQLVDYALQPVIMFAGLYIMNIIFIQLWDAAMNFSICFGGIIDIYFPLATWTDNYLPNVSLGCIQGYITKEVPNFFSMFILFFSLLIFTYSIKGLVDHIPEITGKITGVNTASSIKEASQNTVRGAVDAVGKVLPIKSVRKAANFVARGVEKGVSGAAKGAAWALRGGKFSKKDLEKNRIKDEKKREELISQISAVSGGGKDEGSKKR